MLATVGDSRGNTSKQCFEKKLIFQKLFYMVSRSDFKVCVAVMVLVGVYKV